MQHFKAWLKASRLPAQLFIFPALLLGQAMVFAQQGSINVPIFLMVHLYGLFMHLFIVYANDYADYETDKENQTYTPFTGGSRVLIEGILSQRAMLKGSILLLVLTLLSGGVIAYLSSEYIIILLVSIGILIFHAYSFFPVKLSYRGYGESLQMLGVGMILPLIGYLAQGGAWANLPLSVIIFLLPSQFAMALSTSMPDLPSDQSSGKNTTVVNVGLKKAQIIMLGAYGVSLSYIAIYFQSFTPIIITLPLIVLMGYLLVRHKVIPGSQPLFYFVALSILSNTLLVSSSAFLFTL